MVEYLPLEGRDLDRFWAKVSRPSADSCWLWTGGKVGKEGYGIFSDPLRRSRLAHRYSLIIATGGNQGMYVLHTCDTPSCVNPSHLYWGTQTENIRDCYRRNRGHRATGESNPLAKFNNRQIREIRAAFRALTATLAAQYGVSAGAVRQVARRQTWRHVA